MSMTEQGLQFAMPVVDERINPFHTIESVRRELPGYDEDDICRLCEFGYLLAFDLANGEQDRRRELRILPASVSYFTDANTRRAPFPFDWLKLRETIFKGVIGKTYSRAGDLVEFVENKKARLVLNCSPTHLLSFVPHQIKPVPGSERGPGPKGSPKLLLDSLLDFLRKRRVK